MQLEDVINEILLIVYDFGALPDVPIEGEEFFRKIVSEFAGDKDALLGFIRRQSPIWFSSFSRPPQWVHEPEWQYNNSRPMIFVGQINITTRNRYIHDDSSFYLFWDPTTGDMKSIAQVS